MTLAIFDLDETLISGDSDHAWGEYVVDAGLVDAAEHRRRNDEFYAQYKQGELDINAYLAFSCGVLARHSITDLHAARDIFVQEKILPMVLPAAKALVERHRAEGHELMVITSTIEFITRPIVELFNIDTLIAPVPELINNKYTGQITGTPSFQAGKVTRLMEWLETSTETLSGSYFYSDSCNDLALLEIVDHPIVVDPDDTLRAKAESNAWQILSLRD